MGRHFPVGGRIFVLLDALTLGLYAAVGTQYALDVGVDEVGAVLMRGFPYALLALAGSTLYLVVAPLSGSIAALACVGVVVVLRVVTLGFGIRTRPVRPLPETRS